MTAIGLHDAIKELCPEMCVKTAKAKKAYHGKVKEARHAAAKGSAASGCGTAAKGSAPNNHRAAARGFDAHESGSDRACKLHSWQRWRQKQLCPHASCRCTWP